MSVVAGCVLFDKVLIAADCRLTLRHPDGREECFDNALKVHRIGPFSVLGFVGDDMPAAISILGRMLAQAGSRIRKGIVQEPGRRHLPAHPLRLASWLPRFLRAAYGRVQPRRRLWFMLAYVVPGVPSVLQRSQLAPLFDRVTRGGTRSCPAEWLTQALIAAQQSPSQSVAVLGTYAGRIQVMASPQFRPRLVRPLGFDAIGSGGEAAMVGFATPDYSDLILTSGGFEGFAFDAAIDTFIKRAGIRTVGGMRPTFEISTKGVEAVNSRVGRRRIALEFDPVRGWVQRNEASGMEAPILPLSEAINEIGRGRAGIFTDAHYDF